MKPLRTGLALAITVALFYSLCTLVEILLPRQFMAFMNALFHGMNFQVLATSQPYSWTAYLYAMLVLSLWAFAMGTVFAWLHNAIGRSKSRYQQEIA